MAKPIIFLDLHGVLTNATSKFVYGDKDKLDPVSVRLLIKLAKECDAHIVITSTLAQDLDLNELTELLRAIGGKHLLDYVIGTVGNDSKFTRGGLVDEFVIAYHPDCPDYVILDDKPQLFHKGQHIVPIDPEVGFKLPYYSDAVDYLCPPT